MQNISLKHISILIVDRNPLLRTVFRQVLRELGAENVETANNVDDGFRKFQDLNPDIVLVDWSPGCDGLELLDAIRKDPDSVNCFAPVIIASAYTEAEAVVSARDMGMSEFLAKPVSAQALYKRIARVVNEQRAFVRSSAFFGPDRRRHETEPPLGGRRESDMAMAG